LKRKIIRNLQKKRNKKPSEKKPDIREGITKVDLQTWYNKEDLEAWLRSKGAKVSGKKKSLIDRIHSYLSGDTTLATEKKRGRKRKRGSSKKQKQK